VNTASLKEFWPWLKRKLHWDSLSPGMRRLLVGIVGGTVLLIGVAMIILPGPAIIVIPLGLAILATEFAWAHRWLGKARHWAKKGGQKLRGRSAREGR
jgi:hypothetical protein